MRKWRSAWQGQLSPFLPAIVLLLSPSCLSLSNLFFRYFSPSSVSFCLSTSCLNPFFHSPLSLLPFLHSHLISQMSRQRVKEQIAQDRAAFAAQREAEKQGASSSKDLKTMEPQAQLPQSKPAQKKDYDTCRLQVRLQSACCELFTQVGVLVIADV